jgi:hypothetical protein
MKARARKPSSAEVTDIQASQDRNVLPTSKEDIAPQQAGRDKTGPRQDYDGIPALVLRHVLSACIRADGSLYFGSCRRTWIEERYPDHDPDAVFAILRRHDLVQQHGEEFRLTEAGSELLRTKFVPSLSRANAHALLADVVRRAEQVNMDDRFVKSFTFLGVFGSYLDPNREQIRDLDLFFHLKYKPRWEAALHAADDRSAVLPMIEEHHLTFFPQDDRGYLNLWKGFDKRPLMHIKTRRARLSLHDKSEYLWLVHEKGVAFKTIFGTPPARD